MIFPSPDCILFDLDGTLVDTAPDLTGALNHVLRAHRMAAVKPRRVRNLVSLGARKMIEAGLAANDRRADPAILDAMLAEFLDYYGRNLAVKSVLYPDVRATLRDLAVGGTRLAVCTNKSEGLSRSLLSALGLAAMFPVVMGADSVSARKPDPAHLFETLDKLGGRPASAVMVGDNGVDVEAAKAARIPVILVSHGYSTADPSRLGADRVIDGFRQLPAALAALA